MHSLKIVAFAFCLLVASLAADAHADAVLYRVTDLGTLTAGDSPSAVALNDLGQVVGASGQRAFLWTAGTGMQDLGIPAGFYGAAGVGINQSGQVAVSAHKNSTPFYDGHAFRWSAGVYQDMGTLGGTFSIAYGIDSLGRLAGYAYTSLGAIHAYRSTTGAVLVDINSLGGNYSLGYGINAAGYVVGQAYNASNQYHAFLSTGGGMQDLGTLGGTQSQADDISDAGIIVGGSSTTGDASYHAFIYQAGVMTDLGSPTAFSSRAYAVNDAAQVIGSYSDGTYGHPFLWDSVSGMRNLNSLLEPVSGAGWTLLDANDINNRGQIVGQGFHNGVVSAYLLTPLPEPGTIALLALGAGACVITRMRRGR